MAALLGILLASHGNVVTRADLQARLWPDSTVEFDDGLNFCVRQLRIALGDDASEPTYIETLPRRGYRFIPQVAFDLPDVGPAATAIPPASRRRAQLTGALAVAVLVGAVFAWNARATMAPRHTSIALQVVPFTADTTDRMLAGYRARLLERIVSSARAEHIWDVLDTAASGATHQLRGSLTRDGNSVKLFVELVGTKDRRKLWADDIVDTYAFSGNSTMTADRIEKSVSRILADTISGAGPSRR